MKARRISLSLLTLVDEPDDLTDTPTDVTEAAIVCHLSGEEQGFWFRGTDAVVVSVQGTETPTTALSMVADLPLVTAS
ncbi:hypothetical protein [Nakamurella leprariae]|uniref:Uncharacterized protein n=1 Tax=Nakamurella leprariae TaxID=2803911 RepID=A0A938YBJ0_9ACTN|nr:hypothetical protein [Nakamurella leprariae]MBM9466566.1 hypothetical protein [Nakamurella leprariae]